jgi:hypothetical protein
MGEAEWLAAEEPGPMLAWLLGQRRGEVVPHGPGNKAVSGRKLRLFAAACTLLIPGRDARLRRAVGAALAFADGGLGAPEMEAARWGQPPGPWTVCHPDAGEAAYYVIRDDSLTGRRAEMAALLRDVFGNPFRPYCDLCPHDGTGVGVLRHFDPAWRTPAAVGIARRAYDERDFGALPVLADALEEVGCEDSDILAHCRSPGPHVRGCHVLDLVLGKS